MVQPMALESEMGHERSNCEPSRNLPFGSKGCLGYRSPETPVIGNAIAGHVPDGMKSERMGQQRQEQ